MNDERAAKWVIFLAGAATVLAALGFLFVEGREAIYLLSVLINGALFVTAVSRYQMRAKP